MIKNLPPLIVERLRNLPHLAGVYLFKDAGGNIIYIGKAKHLDNRVRSYFQSPERQERKVQLIVEEAVDVDYILAENEAHALRWEADLIRRERPRYNVRMRDDKKYPYIRIAVQDPFPRVGISRSVLNDGARYFGPFTDSSAVRTTLDTLNLLFPYVRCRKEITGTDRRPCLYYHIKRCVAPCTGAASQAEYRQLIDDAVSFLEGKQEQALDDLRRQMEEASEALQFERAAGLRDRIRAASRVIEQQRVVIKKRSDQDVIGVARENDNVFAQVFYIREGKLRGRDYFPLVATPDETEDVIVRSFILEHYGATEQIPPRILVPTLPDDAAQIEGWLREQAGHRVALTLPERGEGRRLVELATTNAREALERQKIEWQADERRTTGAIEDLQEHLELDTVPERIECYDISNIQGTSSVGSLVVFEDGRPKRSDYKRFKIKTVQGANDFAMMAEVLTRRFKRLRDGQAEAGAGGRSERGGASWDRVPDLVIVDGGKGQLSAALAVMESLELVAIPVVGLAKEREEIFLPSRPDPILLPRGSESLFLVQRIRDEAHRFAITYHRVVRGKKSLHSALDDVPGVGPKRKRELLRAFGSVRGIKAATIDEIAAVPGMTRRSADALKAQL
jgi:excinuclease ABC subunit C